MQSIFKPHHSETDEVNRCERFPLTPCARTFQNKESSLQYHDLLFELESAALIPAQLGILRLINLDAQGLKNPH